MKKIIVTGGAGYIGSHTSIELYNAGYIPILVDNLCNTSIKNIHGIEKIIGKKIKWYNINCTEESLMSKMFDEEGDIEGVIHFAAYKAVAESVQKPQKYYKNNIGSLEVVLKCMKENNVRNIIFSSSCTVYGEPDTLPVDENAQFKKSESPYGETKQICEKILEKNLCHSVSLRYFNPIGSHHSGLIGDCSADKPSNLVPIITELAIGKREEIIVFGQDYNTPDGTCIRDYIHVVDLANSHVKALDYLIKEPGKYAFNVGTGKGVSVLEAIQIFERVNKMKIKYKVGERRKGDIEKIYSDNSLISKELEWSAKISLNQAMKDAWNWEQKKKHL